MARSVARSWVGMRWVSQSPRAPISGETNSGEHIVTKLTARRGVVCKSILSAAAILLTLPSSEAAAQVFARKTITIYIANTAGGSYDIYGRLIGRHLGNHLPGNPAVVVSNKPGGGGLIAANYLYDVAPKNGTALAVLVETVALEQALNEPAAKYDATKFNWIGRVASSVNIHMQWHTSKVQSIADAQRIESTVAGTGPGNLAEVVPRVLNATIGTKFKIVSGYPASNEAMIAMERGEVEGSATSWAAVKVGKQQWLQDKKIKIILQDLPERNAELPDVPALGELGSTPEEKGVLGIYAGNGAIGRSLVAPPGVPAEIVKALRDGFAEMVKDPEFVAEIRKLKIDLDPANGDQLQASTKKILDIPDSVRQRAKAIFGR
jgi:tripartite-type tricarboxylate transporter receptor subunit TctC